MNRNPSKFFPFERPIYGDFVFYLFLFLSVQGMREDLTNFFNYGDSSRLFPLLFDFLNSVFVAWIFSIIANWLRGKVIIRIEKRRNIKKESKKEIEVTELRITKLDKPINEMTADERRAAAEKLAEIVLNQAEEYKKKNN
jgi:hypothetical protein